MPLTHGWEMVSDFAKNPAWFIRRAIAQVSGGTQQRLGRHDAKRRSCLSFLSHGAQSAKSLASRTSVDEFNTWQVVWSVLLISEK
jgi:hypothetical protein